MAIMIQLPMNKTVISALLLLAPFVFGILTRIAIAEDNEISNTNNIARWQAEADRVPVAITEPVTTFVPVLSVIWVALSIFGILYFFYLLFRMRNPPKFFLVLVLLNIFIHMPPLRWYPPPLKNNFISNLHKYIHIVPKKDA